MKMKKKCNIKKVYSHEPPLPASLLLYFELNERGEKWKKGKKGKKERNDKYLKKRKENWNSRCTYVESAMMRS